MTDKDRLLHQIKPLEYTLLFKPNLESFTFSAEESLLCDVLTPTKKITLHAHNLEVAKASLVVNGEEHIAEISYNKKSKTVTLTFPQTLQKGQHTLDLLFSGKISNTLRGWYKSAYTVGGEKRHLATTQFEEIGAREVFVSIDDPLAKAIFNVSFVIPSHLTAISNTIDTVVAEHDGFKTVQFAPTPKMSSYALAFIVGDFEYIEKKITSGVNVRVFVTPGKKSQAQFALETVVKMLPFYEKYFDIAYPLPVLDLIAIPDFDAGAMENWGAITAREVALLVDEEQTSSANKQWVATVIAHELTHMWFGNLVTMKWWDDLWLNEGFASYMEYVGLHEFFPQWNVWEQFAVLDHNRALGLDSLENTHPIQAQITDVEKVSEIFDAVSYSKGACVIQMLVNFLGEKDFQKGLQIYLKKHQYGNAETQDLWNSLEEASGKKIKNMIHAYTSQPGHPLVQVTSNNNSLTLSQTRFYSSLLSRKNSQDTTLWQIPLSVQKPTSTTEEIFLKDVSLTVPFSDSWIKLNKGETSFARVMYDAKVYKNFQQPIEQKVLSSIDRMGLVRDAFDSAESGYLPTDNALLLAKNYTKEDSYIVWAALLGKLGTIENLLSQDALLPSFHMFVRHLLGEIKKKTTWEKRPTDSHSDILLRSTILASLTQYEDKETIAKALELFTQIAKNNKSIDTDIRGVVYAAVAENGEVKEYETLQQLYIQEELATEKNRIGNALCLFSDKLLIQKTLEFSLSEHVRTQDIGRFLVMSFGNKKGKSITWNFIKTHWDELLEKMAGIGMDWIIEGASSVVEENLAEDIKKFFATHPHPKLERTMKQVIEQIESNRDWLKRDREAIENFLSKAV
ncbi:MAG TPA: M1 family metallopeptidase [Candidatus Eisenbacteria bacterium]|nr:M1 family metallopeptidase [Candidatus Eisenbacteria bacterium]